MSNNEFGDADTLFTYTLFDNTLGVVIIKRSAIVLFIIKKSKLKKYHASLEQRCPKSGNRDGCSWNAGNGGCKTPECE